MRKMLDFPSSTLETPDFVKNGSKINSCAPNDRIFGGTTKFTLIILQYKVTHSNKKQKMESQISPRECELTKMIETIGGH